MVSWTRFIMHWFSPEYNMRFQRIIKDINFDSIYILSSSFLLSVPVRMSLDWIKKATYLHTCLLKN